LTRRHGAENTQKTRKTKNRGCEEDEDGKITEK